MWHGGQKSQDLGASSGFVASQLCDCNDILLAESLMCLSVKWRDHQDVITSLCYITLLNNQSSDDKIFGTRKEPKGKPDSDTIH